MKFNKKLLLLTALAVLGMAGCENRDNPGGDNPPETHVHHGGTATCTETAICDECHEHYGDLGDHNYGTLHSAVEATCDTDGNIAYYQCSVCNKYFNESKQEVASIVVEKHHTYGDWIAEQAATCTEEGVAGHYHCTKCDKDLDENGAELATLVLQALGHAGDPGEGHYTKVNATGKLCTGTYTYDEGYECTRCHEFITVHEDVVDPTNGHNYVYTHIPGTETHTGTCNRETCVDGDEGHTIVEACSYSDEYSFEVQDSKLYKKYTCTKCGGAKLVLVEDKVYTPTEAIETFTEELIGFKEILDYKITVTGTVKSVSYSNEKFDIALEAGDKNFILYRAVFDSEITEDFNTYADSLKDTVISCSGYPYVHGYNTGTYRAFELVANGEDNAKVISVSDAAYKSVIETKIKASLLASYAYDENQQEATDINLFAAYNKDGKNVTVNYELDNNCTILATLDGNKLSFLPTSAKRTVIVKYSFTLGNELINGTIKSVIGGEELPAGGKDTLTVDLTAASGTSYTSTNGVKTASGAVYNFNSAKDKGSIQMRNKTNAGIVSTKSGGKLVSVKITWEPSTSAARVALIYASNTAYTATSDLYTGSAVAELAFADRNNKNETVYTFTNDFTYIGLRGKDGAQYWKSVEIVWESAGFVEPHECNFQLTSDENQHWNACSICGDIKGNKENHTWGEAGCTEYVTCTVCGYTSTTIKGSNHNLGTLIAAKAPNCTEAGNIAYYQCADCGKLFNENKEEVSSVTLAALGHEKGDHHDAHDADCESEGTVEYWDCSRCGETINDSKEVITTTVCNPALGHDYVKHAAVAPTCTETGNEEYYTCSRCSKLFKKVGEEYQEIDAIPTLAAKGHNYVPTVTDPTCEEGGYTTHTCSNCGDSYVDSQVAANGHSYVYHPAVAPTVEAGGNLAYYTCEHCDKYFNENKEEVEYSSLLLAPLGKNVQVGDNYYESLTAALDAVASNSAEPVTVYLLEDLTGKGLVINNKNVVLDLGGHTYTVDEAVGSTGTETLGLQLLKGSKVTIKNGEFKKTSDSNVKMMINNYCDTVLDNVVIDMSEESAVNYVVSNNNGSLLIKNETKLIAAEGKVVLDAWYGMFADYDGGVAITVDSSFSGSLEGIIEYGANAAGAGRNENWKNVTSINLSAANLEKLDVTFKVAGSAISDIREANITLPAGMAMNSEGKIVEAEASVNGVLYATVNEAIEAAQDGDTVVLEKDCTLEERVNVTDDLTIDMNGHNLTTVQSVGTSFGVYANGSLTIVGSENTTFEGAIVLFEAGATVDVTGGNYVSHIDQDYYAFWVSGNIQEGHATLNVTDAKVTGSEMAFGVMGCSYVTIKNCTVEGLTGIYMKAGTVIIINSDIKGTGTYAEPIAYGNGAYTTGDGIILDSKQGYQGEMNLYIDADSTVTSTNAYAIRQAVTDAEEVKVFITTLGELEGLKGQLSLSLDYVFSSTFSQLFIYDNLECEAITNDNLIIIDTFEKVINNPDVEDIILLDTVSFSSTIVIDRLLEIDLGNETLFFLTEGNDYAFYVKEGANFMLNTYKDGAFISGGRGIYVEGGIVKVAVDMLCEERCLGIYGGSVEVRKGIELTSMETDITVFIRGNSTLEVEGTITNNGDNFALCGSGNDSDPTKSPTVTIKDGACISSEEDIAVYWPCAGTLNIEGGNFGGATALYIKSGTVTITGGSFVGIMEEAQAYDYYGNGANPTGDAIVIDNCNYPGGAPVVTIKDIMGMATGELIASYASNGQEVITNFLAEGVVKFEDLGFTYYTTATVYGDGEFYDTIQEALEDECLEIVLLRDIVDQPSFLSISSEVTIKLNGHSYATAEGVTVAIKLYAGAELTIIGDANSSFYGQIVLFSNEASLTIDGGAYSFDMLDKALINVNGNVQQAGAVITLSNATFTSNDVTFYLAGVAETTVTNCTINGLTGIYMKAGTLSLINSTVNATGAYYEPVANGNGGNTTGDAIILDSKVGYAGNISLNVDDQSSLNSANGYAVREAYTDATASSTLTINLNKATLVGAKGQVFLSSYFLAKVEASEANFIYEAAVAYGLVNGNAIYASVDALAALNPTKIVLLANASMTVTLNVNADLVIDLGGYTLTATVENNSYAIVVNAGALTITNGTLVSNYRGINVLGGNVTVDANITAVNRALGIYGGSVAINANKLVKSTSGNDPTIFVKGNATVVIAGNVKNEGAHAALCGNGDDTETGLSVTIKETANLESTNEAAIYWPCAGTLAIEGGKIKGLTALYIKSGTVTITGGEFIATGEATALVHSNNGWNCTGDAIVVENCGYPSSTPVVTLAGCTFVVTDANAKEVGTYAYGDYQPLVLTLTSTSKYEHTFASGDLSTNGGIKTLSNVQWDTTDATYMSFVAGSGVQIGSGNKPEGNFFIASDKFKGTIQTIKVTASTGSSGVSTLKVFVNDVQYGETVDLTTTSTEYSFTVNAKGNIRIELSASAKAMYLKKIVVEQEITKTYQADSVTLANAMAKLPADLFAESYKYGINDKELITEIDGVDFAYDIKEKDSLVASENVSIAQGKLTIAKDEEEITYVAKVTGTYGACSDSKEYEFTVDAIGEYQVTVAEVLGLLFDEDDTFVVTGYHSSTSDTYHYVDDLNGNKIRVYLGSKASDYAVFAGIHGTGADQDTITVSGKLSEQYKNFQNPTVTINHKDVTVTIDNSIENGTVVADKATYKCGETATLTVTPAANYSLSWVKANGTEVTITDGTGTFVIKGNTTITALFAQNMTDAEKVAYEKANCTFGELKKTYTVDDTIELPTYTKSMYNDVTVTFTLNDETVTDTYTFTEVATDLSFKAVFTCGVESDSKELGKIKVEEKSAEPVTTTAASMDLTNGIKATGGEGSSTASKKSGYYQSGSNTYNFTLLSSKELFKNATNVTFKAKLGGGTAKDKLGNDVMVVLLGSDGSEISSTSASVTSKITSASGSEFTVNITYTGSVYGFKVYHTKESGYNVRYYSFSLLFTK